MFGALTALLCCSATIANQGNNLFADTDHDGLLDIWETIGIGPINPQILGCKPNHTDIIVVFRIRSMMTQLTIQPTIDRLKRYFSELPNKNLDGTTGVNLIAIVPPPMPKETDSKGYQELYEQGMPPEWRGFAHGILVDNSPGGGGQSNRPDWCGCGYNWHTMAHELGHQFGLPHEPLGAKTGSPFHPSLMNYDYSYQLGGKSEAVSYSTGKFKKMSMKETDLNEIVQFPMTDLSFLTKQPYFFKLKKVTDITTAVDWNRNGVFGENHVRADINDGYSAGYSHEIRLGKTAGAPSLVSLGKGLAVIFPDFASASGYEKFDKASLSPDKPGNLKARIILNDKAGSIQHLADDVTGDPSAIFSKRTLWLGYPVAKGYAVKTFSIRKKNVIEQETHDRYGTPGMIPTLVDSPYGPIVLVWNPATKTVTVNSVEGDPAEPLDGIETGYPVGAVWNNLRDCLSVVAVVNQGKKLNRIRIFNYSKFGRNWRPLDAMWIEGEAGNAAASSRCQVVFDDSKDRGPNGGYNVFLKGNYPDPNQAGLNFLCRQIEDRTIGDGWRVRMMGNEWAFTRSVCAVAKHNHDIAYAMRWSDESLAVYMQASGIENALLTDFDEVSYICNRGFASSLKAVRDEQWPKLSVTVKK
jgi:hypothetical protein